MDDADDMVDWADVQALVWERRTMQPWNWVPWIGPSGPRKIFAAGLRGGYEEARAELMAWARRPWCGR